MKTPFTHFIETELPANAVLITCGLPATGKTTAAAGVREIKGYSIIRSDFVRREVLKGEDIFDERVAADMGKRRKVYDEVFRRAEDALPEGGGLILDASFVSQELRRRAADIAARHKRPLVIMELSCPENVALARIARRTPEQYESNALTEQAYFNNKAAFEEVDLDDLRSRYPGLDILHFIVDTRHDSPERWRIVGVARK